eukprot:tig00000057_g47.t1
MPRLGQAVLALLLSSLTASAFVADAPDPGGARRGGNVLMNDRPLVDVSGGPAAGLAAVESPEDVALRDFLAEIGAGGAQTHFSPARTHEPDPPPPPAALSDEPEAHAAFAEGERLFYAERLEEALAFFARVPHGHRRYVDALWYQACTYVGFRRDEEAIRALEAYEAVSPGNHRVLYALGQAKLRKNDWRGSREAFQRASALDPNSIEYLFWLGYTQEERDKATTLRRVIERDPRSNYAQLSWGHVVAVGSSRCEWRSWEGDVANLQDAIEAWFDRPVDPATPMAPCVPLWTLYLPLKNWVRTEVASKTSHTMLQHVEAAGLQPLPPLFSPLNPPAGARLKIAYMFAYVGNHVTAMFIQSAVTSHDRSRFEVFVYALHSDPGTLAHSVISSKAEVVAMRPAPVCIQYFGIAGTTGAPYVDYVLADRVSVTPQLSPLMTERVLLLPDPYLYLISRLFLPRPPAACPLPALPPTALLLPTARGSHPETTRRRIDSFSPAHRPPPSSFPPPAARHSHPKNIRRRVHPENAAAGAMPALDFLRRADFGLPDDAVVAAAFHQQFKQFKVRSQELNLREDEVCVSRLLNGSRSALEGLEVNPTIFRVWTNALRRCPRALLWIYERDGAAGIRREADAAGVGAARVRGSGNVAHPLGHLSRLALADLFLDTPVYNAHTTLVDAMWAGTPAVAVAGEHMASRVAAAALRAATARPGEPGAAPGSGEGTGRGYVAPGDRGVPQGVRGHGGPVDVRRRGARAAGGGRRRGAGAAPSDGRPRPVPPGAERLAALRERLLGARARSALFDTAGWTRAVERMAEAAWDAYEAGEGAAHFQVAPAPALAGPAADPAGPPG